MMLHLRCYPEVIRSIKRYLQTRHIFELDEEEDSDTFSTIKVSIFYFTKEEQILLLQATKTRRFLVKWRHLPVAKTQQLVSYLFAGSQHMEEHHDTIHIGFSVVHMGEELQYQLLRLAVLTSTYELDGLLYVIVPRVEQMFFMFPEPYIQPSYTVQNNTILTISN
jgi:hypothetical protein